MRKFLQQLQATKNIGAKSFAINGIWILLEKTIRLITALISSVWLARYLQPSQYGALSYAIVFISLFSNLTSLGLRDVVIREYITARNSSENQKKLADTVLNSAVIMRFWAGVLAVSCIALYLYFFIDNGLEKKLIFIISTGLIFKVSEVFEYPFEANIDIKSVSLVRSVAWLLKIMILGLLISFKQSIYILAIVLPFESLVLLLLLFYIYRRKRYGFQPIKLFSRQKALNLLKNSWPLMISGLAIIIYMRADQIMLKSMVGNYEVGLYSAAAQLIEAIYVFPVAIINAVLPKLIQAKLDGESVLMERQQRLYDLTALISYVIIICTFIFSRTIVFNIYGDSYIEASIILSILAWSILPVTLGVARSNFFIIENCPEIKLQIVLVSCVLNIGLNFWLIPIWAGVGAAVSTLISYYFAVFLACFLWRRLRPTGYMLLKGLWPIRLFNSDRP